MENGPVVISIPTVLVHLALSLDVELMVSVAATLTKQIQGVGEIQQMMEEVEIVHAILGGVVVIHSVVIIHSDGVAGLSLARVDEGNAEVVYSKVKEEVTRAKEGTLMTVEPKSLRNDEEMVKERAKEEAGRDVKGTDCSETSP